MNQNNRFKFRVWEKEHNRFLYPKEGSAETIDSRTGEGAYGHAVGGTGGISVGLTLNGLPYYRCVNMMGPLDNSIVQQYTGIEDKNGREIYEGDLVNFEYEIGPGDWEKETKQEVFFEEGIFYFGRDLKFATNDCNFNKKSLEVVGNIFENKGKVGFSKGEMKVIIDSDRTVTGLIV